MFGRFGNLVAIFLGRPQKPHQQYLQQPTLDRSRTIRTPLVLDDASLTTPLFMKCPPLFEIWAGVDRKTGGVQQQSQTFMAVKKNV